MVINLKISGMGILIKSHVKIIVEKLKECGYEVQVSDPEDNPFWYKMSEQDPQESKILVSVEHEPWGG